MWSKDLIVELLQLYKSFPCLWKIKSEEYKNKNKKEDAYKCLVTFCKEKGFPEATREFVVKKIQSLRGSFRKELKKVYDSQRSGKGADEVYTPSLWYYNHLLFTKDQEQPTSSFSNDDVSEVGTEETELDVLTEQTAIEDDFEDTIGQQQQVVSYKSFVFIFKFTNILFPYKN